MECHNDHPDSKDDCDADSECTWCITSGGPDPRCVSVRDTEWWPYPIYACDKEALVGKTVEECKAIGTDDKDKGKDSKCNKDKDCVMCHNGGSYICDEINNAHNILPTTYTCDFSDSDK